MRSPLPCLLAAVGLAACAAGPTPPDADAAPRLQRVGTFAAPVYVTAPPRDRRLFVVERAGLVRVVGRDGRVARRPWADLRRFTTTDGERGLLSLAFPPDYARSGRAYVFLTARDGALQVRELRRSRDPGRARPGRGRLVIAQPHGAFPNHNGGGLQFGPDGALYVAMGDGGSGNDPSNHAQRTSTLLGKLLRISPRASGRRAYAIPSGNPFAGVAGARPEIWSLGLRNPFRFSFDAATGDLWIGDVGQGAREEVDFAAAADGGGRGANFGWRCYEGAIRTPGDGAGPLCSDAEAAFPRVAPLLDRAHPAVASITGGYVVRDPLVPSLRGRYLHGDLADPVIRSVAAGDPSGDRPTGLRVTTLVSFGEDACGRVYVVSLEGAVSRIVERRRRRCALRPAPG